MRIKVYELLNKLKGTDATLEQIKTWAYMNRILPCEFRNSLELDCEYPGALSKIETKICNKIGISDGCNKCLDMFLVEEIE